MNSWNVGAAFCRLCNVRCLMTVCSMFVMLVVAVGFIHEFNMLMYRLIFEMTAYNCAWSQHVGEKSSKLQ